MCIEFKSENQHGFLQCAVTNMKSVRFETIRDESYGIDGVQCYIHRVRGRIGAFNCLLEVTEQAFVVSITNNLGIDSHLNTKLVYRDFRRGDFDQLNQAVSRLNLVATIFGESGHLA